MMRSGNVSPGEGEINFCEFMCKNDITPKNMIFELVNLEIFGVCLLFVYSNILFLQNKLVVLFYVIISRFY